jgi:hypothetical protein
MLAQVALLAQEARITANLCRLCRKCKRCSSDIFVLTSLYNFNSKQYLLGLLLQSDRIWPDRTFSYKNGLFSH